MKIRKINIFFRISLSLFLMSFLVSSCTEKKWDGNLILWHAYPKGKERKALQQVADNFNRTNAGFKIKLLSIPFGAFSKKLTNTIPRGKGPDVFIFGHDQIGDWAEKLYIEPLEFLMTKQIKSRFLQMTLNSFIYQDQALSNMIFEGSIYGLPLSFKVLALFYNKKLVKTVPTSTKELIAFSKKLTYKDKVSNKKVYGLIYPNTGLFFHSAWLYGFGGHIFNSKGEVDINNSQTKASVVFARDLYQKHKIVPDEINGALITSLFNKNRAAFVINGPWFKAEIDKSIDYGITVLPVISQMNKNAKPFLTVEGILMNSFSKHKKEAFVFMQYLTNSQSALIMTKTGGQISAIKSVYKDKELQKNQKIMVFKKQQENSIATPNKPDIKKVWKPFGTMLQNVIQKTDQELKKYSKENKKDYIANEIIKAQRSIEEAIRESIY